VVMHGDRIRVSHEALSTMKKLCRDGWRVATRPNAQSCSLLAFAWASKRIGHSLERLRYKVSCRLRRWRLPTTAHRLPQQLASQYSSAKDFEKLFQLLFNPNPCPFPSCSSLKSSLLSGHVSRQEPTVGIPDSEYFALTVSY
jgi:hypothetical protein